MIQKLRRLFGAKALTEMRFPGRSFVFLDWVRPDSSAIKSEVGHGLDANVIMTPIRWLQRAFVEAPVQVVRNEEPVEGHELVSIINKPNAFYAGEHLWAGTVLSLALDGNAYWLVVRNGRGRVIELWYVPHWLIEPKWPDDGSVFISHYEYSASGRILKLDVTDVVHFRDGIDPENLRKGLSPLKSLLREVWTDQEASVFTASMLRNGGIPGVVVSPDGDGFISPEEAQAVKQYFAREFTRENRGKPIVLSGRTKVDQFGFSPQQLDLSALRNISEERVSAALGVPAAVLGFGTGLEQTRVGAPQPLTATLWTPTGCITMGDVCVGQTVAIPGGWAEVEAVYPQGKQEIYAVTFNDGSVVECTLDHIWRIYTPNIGWQDLPLAEIIKFPSWKFKRVQVPEQGAVEFEFRDTYIPPYLMGILLADGHLGHAMTLCNLDNEIVERVRAELPDGYALIKIDDLNYRISYTRVESFGKGGGSGRYNPLKCELRRLGLFGKKSNEKFIPDCYKFNSVKTRLDLLRGIMDGDGYVHKNGQPCLEQTSPRLADDVSWVVRSLGGYTWRHVKKTDPTKEKSITNRRGSGKFNSRYDLVCLFFTVRDAKDFFWCSTKRDKARARVKSCKRRFVSVEYVRCDEAQCIKLPGALYLTDGFIPTHNTLKELRRLAWENGVIPVQRVVAAQITNSLLSPGERLEFDTSEVTALQEDETARVERIVRLVSAGVWTRGEAREATGVEVKPEDDIFLVPMNAIETPRGGVRTPVQPIQPEKQLKAASLVDERLTETAPRATSIPEVVEQIAKAMDRIGIEYARYMEDDLLPFFYRLGRDGKPLVERYLPEEYKQTEQEFLFVEQVLEGLAMADRLPIFQQIFERHYLRVAEETYGVVSGILGLEIGLPDPVARAVVAASGRRAGLIDLTEQTKRVLFDRITRGRAMGLGGQNLAAYIVEGLPAGPWSTPEIRAMVIARTETKYAQNVSTVLTTRHGGVERVIVLDNRTGFNDDVCPPRNGLILTLEEAEQIIMVEHPNGSMCLSPLPPMLYEEMVEEGRIRESGGVTRMITGV